ncbi:MAG TPA: MFS transporter [Myxococcota bacterium]|nr:MFS transporter [Myxococcota bacterium]
MSTPAPLRNGSALLRQRDFRRLFAARAVSAFGTGMAFVALPFGVLHVVGSDHPGPVGWVAASATATQLGFQLFAGALADRGSRQRMLVVGDALAATSQAVFAALLVADVATVPAMMGLAAVTGLALALHHPASVGLVPLVVERRDLVPGNALLSAAVHSTQGLGAAAGGLLVAAAGAGVALAFDAASFAVSGLLVWTLRPSLQPRLASPGLWSELRAGWAEFTSHRWLWTIVLQFSLLVMGWHATYGVIGPIVADRAMGGAADWGWVAAGLGLGLVAGALVAMRVRIARPMLVGSIGTLGLALLPLLLIEPAPLPWLVAGTFVGGLGIEVFGVLWNTALHTRVAPEMLSRVSAYDAVGSMALAPLGEALAGTMVARVGTAPALELAAAAIVVPTLLVLLVPEVRQLRSA